MSVGTLVLREEGRILSLYQDSPEADRPPSPARTE
jgi:hypothetical protein